MANNEAQLLFTLGLIGATLVCGLAQGAAGPAELSYVKAKSAVGAAGVNLVELGAVNQDAPGIAELPTCANGSPNNGTAKRSPLVPCIDLPGVGSGITVMNGSYFGLLDSGPSASCADLAASGFASAQGKEGEGYFLPTMSPMIVKLNRTNASNFAIDAASSVALRNSNGTRITAIPPPFTNTTAFGPGCAGEQLANLAEGVDPEDLAPIPGTNWMALCEEYGPSVLVVDMSTGQVLARYIPTGLTLEGAGYPVIPALPSVLAQHRSGRGFEGLAVDPTNGAWLVAVMQSNLDGESRVHRAVEMAINKADPAAFTAEKHFVVEGSPVASYNDEPSQGGIKMSAALALSPNRSMILLERATNQVRLFQVDAGAADDISNNTQLANTQFLEKSYLNSTTLPLKSAPKRALWDSKRTIEGGNIGSKLEGVAPLVNDFFFGTSLLLINDNDFGAEGSEATAVWQVELGESAFA